MKIVHPSVHYLSADELRASRIQDEYIQYLGAHVTVAQLSPSFCVSYSVRRGPRVSMNLNELSRDPRELEVQARLRDELTVLLEKQFGGKREDDEYNAIFVLDRNMTQ